MKQSVTALRAFLDASHSVYHAAAYLADTLQKAGYTRLFEGEQWNLAPGGKYYLVRGGTAVLAFRVPQGVVRGFMISASHADRPTFKLKENGILEGTYNRLSVEKYGGMLIHSWLDRPLSLAGRVTVETEQGAQCRLVDIDRDLLMIPNVAIHMNRSANEGYQWNPAVDMLPLLGGKGAGFKLQKLLEKQAGGKILGHDLYLYVRQKATVWGMDKEYISAPALDDLQCVWGCTQGFLQAEPSESIPVLCVFDSEEVGSASNQGAASRLLESTLSRICTALSLEEKRLLAQSFLVSADNAHALHPNHPEYADPQNAPLPGGGIVLKFQASQRYTTDGASAAVMRMVCKKAGVPVQTYCNRADIPGGSTLGCISLSQVSVPSVDIGLAQFAMHSCYETAAVQDSLYLQQAMTAYYSASLEMKGDAFRLL